MTGSRDAGYFEALYAANPDPWDLAGSAYEHAKYRASLAVLGARKFSAGLEVGCSIGVLTASLAQRCAALLALDIVPSALAAARTRCAGQTHVTFENRRIPEAWPAGRFDLMVFSEMLYFLTPADIRRTAALARGALQPGGRILLVNYTAPIDEPCSGNEAAEIFIAAAGLPVCRHAAEEKFRIDLLGEG
jgi:cyclopropane fatty-acyl-phospholipid synthase-like methyltransferase